MSWLSRGFELFPADPAVTAWCDAVRPVALSLAAEPGNRRRWLRHGGTWFVGVDVLPNDAEGRVAGGPALAGRAREAAEDVFGPLPLHRGQVSVTTRGYPRRDAGESEASHRFRQDRDGAHLDGLLPVGAGKRRHQREFHAFILGVCLTEADADAAPLVVWEGSHRLIRDAFASALGGFHPEAWPDIDLTEIYGETRRLVLGTCRRCLVPLRPGEAVLVHRHAIHGIAPWAEGAAATGPGRANVYFRPEVTDRRDWLDRP